MTKFELKEALKNYRKRKKDFEGQQIKNQDLPAGAPMYYYCKFCYAPTAILPESHISSPPTICIPCFELHKLGAI